MSEAISAPAPEEDHHFVMIPLAGGKFTIVSEADAARVSWRRWFATSLKPQRGYQRRLYVTGKVYPDEMVGVMLPNGLPCQRPTVITLHWMITGIKGADHVNRNGLDNRRVNLRPATESQNLANRGLMRNNTSGLKGVGWNPSTGKWQARIVVNRKHRHLGTFSDPIEAARAYNQAAVEAFGEFAWLNPLPPSRQVPQPCAPVHLAGPVDHDLTALVAQAVMEFPQARHEERYLGWRAGARMGQMRPVLRHLTGKGWLEVEREQGRVERRYYTATEAGRDSFAALLADAENCA